MELRPPTRSTRATATSSRNPSTATTFGKKTWYKPGSFSTSELNSIEWYNMELIKVHGDRVRSFWTAPPPRPAAAARRRDQQLLRILQLQQEEADRQPSSSTCPRASWASRATRSWPATATCSRPPYYKKYFNNQKWYKSGGYSSSKLSSTEWYNHQAHQEVGSQEVNIAFAGAAKPAPARFYVRKFRAAWRRFIENA